MNKEQLLYVLKENESLKIKLQRINQSTERLQTRYYDTENHHDTTFPVLQFSHSSLPSGRHSIFLLLQMPFP